VNQINAVEYVPIARGYEMNRNNSIKKAVTATKPKRLSKGTWVIGLLKWPLIFKFRTVGGPIPIDRGVHMGLFRAVWAYMDLDYQKKRFNVKVEVFEGFERGLKVVQAHLCHLLC